MIERDSYIYLSQEEKVSETQDGLYTYYIIMPPSTPLLLYFISYLQGR